MGSRTCQRSRSSAPSPFTTPLTKQCDLSCCAPAQEEISEGQASFFTVGSFPGWTAVLHAVSLPLRQEPRLRTRTASVQPFFLPAGARPVLQSAAQIPTWIPFSAFHAASASVPTTQAGASGNEARNTPAWCASAGPGSSACSSGSGRCCAAYTGATQILSCPSPARRCATAPVSCVSVRVSNPVLAQPVKWSVASPRETSKYATNSFVAPAATVLALREAGLGSGSFDSPYTVSAWSRRSSSLSFSLSLAYTGRGSLSRLLSLVSTCGSKAAANPPAATLHFSSPSS